MPRSIAFLVLPLLALAPLTGQAVELPVHDLVRSARLVDWLDGEPVKRPVHWIPRQLEHATDGSLVLGEGTLLDDCAVRSLFAPDDLLRILAVLGRFERELDIRGGMLVADERDAAAALAALKQLRHQLPPRLMLELKLERQDAAGRHTLLYARQSVRAGSTVTFGDLEQRRVLRDFEVQIAQSAATANPVVGDLATGACLAVRPRVVPGRGELLIEAFVRVAADAPAAPIETGNDGVGPIDRAARALSECGFAMRLPRGLPRSISWTAANGDRLWLTCSATWADAQPAPARGSVVRCRGLFHKGVAEFRTDFPELEEKPTAFAAEAAFDRAGAESVEIIQGDASSAAAMIVTGAKAQQINTNVASQLVRTLGSAELEVTLLDVAAGIEPAAANSESRSIGRIAGHAIVGKSIAFSGRTEMRYVHDWDVEVAQSARTPDPKVRVLRHGYRVDARVIAGLSGRIEAVALNVRVSRLDRIDAKTVRLCRATRAGGIPQGGPSIVMPKDEVIVESPVLKSHSLSTVVRLDAKGTASLRCAAPRLLGRGRDLVVIVRAQK